MATQDPGKIVTFPAAADLSSYLYRFCKLTTGSVSYVASAGGDADGVIQNNDADAAGKEVAVALLNGGGILKVEAGAATTADAEVQSDAVGRAIDAGSSDRVLGRFIDAAGAAGDIVRFIPGSNPISA